MSAVELVRVWSARPAWAEHAACKGLDPNLFFPERGQSCAEARAVCESCPVMMECREAAIVSGEKQGLWGGLSERQRRRLKAARPRVLPPIVHGSNAGYTAHLRRLEDACPACLEAHRVYQEFRPSRARGAA